MITTCKVIFQFYSLSTLQKLQKQTFRYAWYINTKYIQNTTYRFSIMRKFSCITRISKFQTNLFVAYCVNLGKI